MHYEIADQQCLTIISATQQSAHENLQHQHDQGRAAFDHAIANGCVGGESLVSNALRETADAYALALTSMMNFVDAAAAGGTQAVVYYQTGDMHMADDAAAAAMRATTPEDLPGRGGGRRSGLQSPAL